MTYKEIVEYILSIPKFTKKNTVEDTREFYDFLGCPGEKKRIIHVAGTNGKGSVCSFLNQILVEGKYTVGMFTSPHLVFVEERIRVDGLPISKEEFIDVFYLLREKIEKYEKNNPSYHPTFFEFLFFLSMLSFHKKNVDFIILETGLGGRLDATNIIREPMITVITKIGLDHTEYLGESLREVAFEKAGIIKKNVPLVFWKDKEEIARVIIKRAREQGSDLYPVQEADISCKINNNKSIDFSYKSSYDRNGHYSIRSEADYQIENAVIAIQVLSVLKDQIHLSSEDLKTGLWNMRWPGRMEEIAPGIYLDGAHNLDGVKAILQGSSFKKEEKSILLFSVVKEKNYKEMITELVKSNRFSLICVTKIPGERGLDTQEMKEIFIDSGLNENTEFLLIENPKEAYSYCKEHRNVFKGNSANIYVLGSFYLIGLIIETETA